MSSHPKGDRIAQDAYLTPPGLALAILRGRKLEQYDAIVEPSAGEGAFVEAARMLGFTGRIVAVDVRKECREPCLKKGATKFVHEDFMQYRVREQGCLLVANPPFSQLVPHVERYLHWMNLGKVHVALVLARVGFLTTRRRVPFWSRSWDMLSSVTPLVSRPSFTNGGTDSSEYAVFCFSRLRTTFVALTPALDWKP